MLRGSQDLLPQTLLDEFTVEQHADAVGKQVDHGQVVADEQRGETEVALQLREQLDTFDLQVQHSTALWWNDTFIWGGEYRHSKEAIYSSVSYFANPVTHLDIQNLFAQDSFRLFDNLKITTGIKIENSSFSNVDFMPDLRLAWQVTQDHVLWASVSRAVRTPSKIDRELQVPGYLLPAPRFHSEKLTAYEAGYRGQPLADL